MTNLFWRTFPVTTLTVRQFLGGKAVRVVVAMSAIPCLFALIYLINTTVATPRDYLVEVVFRGLMAPTLLPIMVLILATGALGNEVEDRTLPYLTMKPMGRLRIAFEKLLGVLVVAVPAVLAGLLATYGIVRVAASDYQPVFRRAAENLDLTSVLGPMLVAATAGVVATASVFLFVSLVIPRALLVGIVYVFVWESLLGRFLTGIRIVSIRHYVESIFVDRLDDPAYTLDNATGLRAALIVVVVVSVVSVVLAAWRLRRMNLE